MATVFINAKVLQWAIDRSGLTLEDLEHKFPKIGRWATEQSQPTLRQLESLSKITLTPLGFFFLETPPEDRLPVPYFRTLDDGTVNKPSPDLLETVQTMQQRQSWMHESLVEQGYEQISFVRSVELKETPTSIADQIRDVLGFDREWAASHSTWTDALRDLRETMEKTGILVVVNGVVGNNTHRRLDPSEFRGFVLVDDYAPLVFVNGADSKAAQMFTLAHEIAHVFFGSSAAFDLRDMAPANNQMEMACNSVAAEFLVPKDQIQRIWSSVKNNAEPFQSIARHFKVSTLVAARRALDLKLIKRDDFLKFYREYLNDERRTASHSDGGDFYANQNLRVGQRFASIITRAVREGKLLYSDAYKLTGLYGKSFEHYTSLLGTRGA